ncbi:MAG: tetratricopeptide repeat protein [Rhodospirillales bacterium]|nr:tetratricopeptide repeat protein [Rhodospirillales bacterium]
MKRPKNDRELVKKLVEVNQLIAARKGTEAIERAEQMMRESPDDPIGYFLLGLYAFSQNNFGDAIKLFDSAHERDPDCREYADCLAILYTVTGKLSDGLYFAKLSTTLDSDPYVSPLIPNQLSNYFEALDRIQPSRHFVSAMMSFNAGKIDDAIRSCELELKQNDQHDLCYTLLGKCHLKLGNYAKAAGAFHAATHLNRKNADNPSGLGSTLCHLGRFDEALVCHRRALDLEPESVDRATAALLDADFLPDSLEPVRVELRDDLAARIATLPRSELKIHRGRTQRDRIRVAYLCNVFYDSEQARFIAALFANHDRKRFEIVGYQQSIVKDTVSVDLQSHTGSWREIFDIQDSVMELIINGDEIDVLVDLCGYTQGNRAGLVAARPAPVQLAWLEPPYGIGVHGIDVVLSDGVTQRSDEASVGDGQRTAPMKHGLFALSPFTFLPKVGELPARSADRLTFGGLCDLARLTPEAAALWSRALGAAPRSKLLLGDVDTIAPAVKDRLVDLFGHFGMADRVMFWDAQPEDRLKIEFFRHIDVLLDTYPVAGRLNICKALWMGVPVLSRKGMRRVSQIGASLLASAGRPEWICDGPDDMARLAASFARDLDALAATRRQLRDSVATSDLFSPKRFVQSLEEIYVATVAKAKAAAAAPSGGNSVLWDKPAATTAGRRPAKGKKRPTKQKSPARKARRGK